MINTRPVFWSYISLGVEKRCLIYTHSIGNQKFYDVKLYDDDDDDDNIFMRNCIDNNFVSWLFYFKM